MADMTALRDEFARETLRIATEALETVFQETVSAAPERTGALIAMMDTDGPVMAGDFVATCTILNRSDYAGFTDGGTVAHDIVATQAHGMLVWDGPEGTVFVSGKGGEPAVVHHPGTTGTRWFNGGVPDGEPMASRWERACQQAAT